MIVKCTHCGTENRLGAIFCHGCGKRLDMSAVEEQVEEGKKKEKKKSVLKKTRNIISIILLLLAILVLAGIFLPVPMEYDEPPNRRVITDAKDKTYEVRERSLDRNDPREIEFSEAELTAAVNGVSGLYEKLNERSDDEDDEAAGMLDPELVAVTFLPGKKVKAVLRLGLYKNFKMYNTLIFDFSNGGDAPPFEPVGARVGRVPLPGPLKTLVTGRFEALFSETDAISQIQERVDDVVIEDDELIVILKPR